VLQLEEFLEDFLMHQYDPVDRHERYLKERQLLGRRPASKKPVVTQKTGALHPAVSRTKAPPAKAAPKKSAAQHNKETLSKVSALQAKLEQLRQVLHDLNMQAKARGLDTTTSTGAPGKSSEPSHRTAAQKKAAAEASQKFRDKHKDDPKTPDQQLKEIQTKIDQLTKKIAEMRAKLKAPQKPGTVGDKTR
jgi:ribosomal protein L29